MEWKKMSIHTSTHAPKHQCPIRVWIAQPQDPDSHTSALAKPPSLCLSPTKPIHSPGFPPILHSSPSSIHLDHRTPVQWPFPTFHLVAHHHPLIWALGFPRKGSGWCVRRRGNWWVVGGRSGRREILKKWQKQVVLLQHCRSLRMFGGAWSGEAPLFYRWWRARGRHSRLERSMSNDWGL